MDRIRKRFVLKSLVLLTAFIAVGAGPVLGADVSVPAKSPPPAILQDSWVFIATPYGWLPSINGSSTIKGRTTDVDATFIDLTHREIPKQLFGLMGSFEARKGPFAVMTDLVYMKLGANPSETRSRSIRPEIGGSLSASVDLQFKMFIAEAALAYELARWNSAAPGTGTALDIYAGGRLWWQTAEADLAVNARLNVGDLVLDGQGRAIARSGDVTWFDPLVGLRLRHHFTPTTELMLRGDVGGFGVGSQFSWEAMGAFNWEFARTQSAVWSAMLGYRALQVDYQKGSGNTLYEYDILTHGPILGVSARF
jgi:hypothetical protein